MRYALDTNLAVSALFKLETPPAIVLAAWQMRKFDWVTCEAQVIELRVTLRRPKTIARSLDGLDGIETLLLQVEGRCLVRTLVTPLPKVCRDETDDFLFALFDQGHADAIISGDKDVLALKSKYPILTPRELISKL
jgi:uncharacterized protein